LIVAGLLTIVVTPSAFQEMSGSSESIPSREGLTPSPATSRSLLERLKADDAAAWDRLVGLYSPLVYRWCRRWGLREQELADVLQDVFQAVVTHIASFRKERASDTFRGWLRTISRNKVNDYFRRQGREPEGIGGTEAQTRFAGLPEPRLPEGGSSSEDRSDQLLLGRVLDLIRGEFEDRTWQAFWRTAVDGQSPVDVADELGTSAGAVRVAKSRVLRRLREELGEL
jgi:RNA polymerase sigma-70 factor (ECF subfamily)